MDTIIRGNADELNNSFIDFIKAAFKGKKIAVHIYEENMNETDFLLSNTTNKERLTESIKNVEQNKSLKEYTFENIQQILNDPGE